MGRRYPSATRTTILEKPCLPLPLRPTTWLLYETFSSRYKTARIWYTKTAPMKTGLPVADARRTLTEKLTKHSRVLGYPLDIAAFQGHVEILRMLLGVEKNPRDLFYARQDGVSFANAGNKVASLDACLDQRYEGHQPGLVETLKETKRVPIFDRLYRVCKDTLTNGSRNPWEPKLDKAQTQVKLLTEHFYSAASYGELASMEHLVQFGARPVPKDRRGEKDGQYCTRICSVAECGHADILAYLLDTGAADIGPCSLEAACRHGNPDVVKMLLDHGVKDGYKPGSALLASVQRENEAVVRLLLERDALLDQDQLRKALHAAEEEGILSMAKMLQEYIYK